MTATPEPIYHYKKGQGWVLGPECPVSIVAGIYKLTLEQRKPEPGERWRLDNTRVGLQKYIDQILNEGWDFNSPNLINELGVSYSKFRIYDDDTTVFFTLKLERL